MEDDNGNEVVHITTNAKANMYNASHGVFEGILKEIRTLSNKKPEATLSIGKVKLINRVLMDLLEFLKDQPEGKYLDALDEDALPQTSDAVLAMVQFEIALGNFRRRHRREIGGVSEWMTEEFIAENDQPAGSDEDDQDEIETDDDSEADAKT